MNPTRSNLIIISLFAFGVIVGLKFSSSADTPIPQKLIAHEFDLADASGKIVGTMSVTKNNEPKIEIYENHNGRSGSILLELNHGNPLVTCISMKGTKTTGTMLISNKYRSGIMFLKTHTKTGNSIISMVGTDSSKIQVMKYKSGFPPVMQFLNCTVNAIPIGSTMSASSIQTDCPKGYHYECLICQNGRFVGYVKNGYHEEDGPNGVYTEADSKIPK